MRFLFYFLKQVGIAVDLSTGGSRALIDKSLRPGDPLTE